MQLWRSQDKRFKYFLWEKTPQIKNWNTWLRACWIFNKVTDEQAKSWLKMETMSISRYFCFDGTNAPLIFSGYASIQLFDWKMLRNLPFKNTMANDCFNKFIKIILDNTTCLKMDTWTDVFSTFFWYFWNNSWNNSQQRVTSK